MLLHFFFLGAVGSKSAFDHGIVTDRGATVSWNVNSSPPWHKPQRTFWNPFCWMKKFELWLKFHWNLFLRVQRVRISDKPLSGPMMTQFFDTLYMRYWGRWVNEYPWSISGIVAGMSSANERPHYFVTSSVIGWAISCEYLWLCLFCPQSL